MVSVNASVFIQIVNFIFLIWALNTVLFKPIRSMLRQRSDKVSGLSQTITSLQSDAAEKEAAFASGIKEARGKGLEEKKTLLQAAAEEEKRIIAQINAKAQADLAALRQRIVTDTDGVRQSLQRELDGFARAIGHKILGREV
jgi:F-type H+-transporting ATPase subunit b